MCFAPQRRTLFRHRNFQKLSKPCVSCTFWLGNVLCATTACTFSTSQLPKVVRTWCAFVHFDLEMCFAPQRALFRHRNFQRWSEPGVLLYILTWKCASRHNGVHFFISHLARWLRTRRFSAYFSALRSLKSLRKIHCFATFLPFRASASSFFWLFLFSHLLSSISAFHLSILSEVWLLNFLRLMVTIFRIVYNVCVTGIHYIYYDQLSPDIAPKHQGDTDIHPLLQGEVCPPPAQKPPGWRQGFWGWPLGEDVVERPVPVARRGTRVGGYNGGLNVTNGSMARQLAMPEW